MLLGIIGRIYGLDEIQNRYKEMVMLCLMYILYPFYFFIFRALNNLEVQSLTSVNKLIKENETVKYVSQEFYDIFHTLQEGIVLINDGSIGFTNNKF